MNKPESIDAYIARHPKSVQLLLQQLRTTIKKAAPEASETISYGIPTFRQNGNLVHFGAYKDHISFFPTSSGVAAFKEELAAYRLARGTVKFSFEEKLPLALISRIVKFRVKESRSKGSPNARKANVLKAK